MVKFAKILLFLGLFSFINVGASYSLARSKPNTVIKKTITTKPKLTRSRVPPKKKYRKAKKNNSPIRGRSSKSNHPRRKPSKSSHPRRKPSKSRPSRRKTYSPINFYFVGGELGMNAGLGFHFSDDLGTQSSYKPKYIFGVLGINAGMGTHHFRGGWFYNVMASLRMIGASRDVHQSQEAIAIGRLPKKNTAELTSIMFEGMFGPELRPNIRLGLLTGVGLGLFSVEYASVGGGRGYCRRGGGAISCNYSRTGRAKGNSILLDFGIAGEYQLSRHHALNIALRQYMTLFGTIKHKYIDKRGNIPWEYKDFGINAPILFTVGYKYMF